MSNLDMTEAIRMLAGDRGISVDSLLQVLVEALATAYKKRQGAAEEVIVGINPENMDITFTAYDVDDDGNWINERDDTPKKDELGRIAAQTFRQVMGQRIREVERDRKFEEYANREGDIVTGIIQQTDSRYTLLDLGRVELDAAPLGIERGEHAARDECRAVAAVRMRGERRGCGGGDDRCARASRRGGGRGGSS